MPLQLQEATPRITHRQLAAGSIAFVQGRWTAARMADPLAWADLEPSLARLQAVPAGELQWDLRGVQRLDHVGAQLLWNHWGRQWPHALLVAAPQRAMLERVAKYTVAPPQPDNGDAWQQYLALGRRVLRALEQLRDLTRLLGQLVLDLGRLARAPRAGPWRDVSGHLYHIGTTALPITALVGFLIGVVLAYLMAQQLRQFGADAFIVNILGIALIRELGPVLAAILIAGRSGSAMTAQIGVMRVNEELDAMRVMGIPHGYRLVMPRALAMAVAMPLISVWTTLWALLGGLLAADLVLGLTPAYFLSALPGAVELSNLTLAVGKSLVFGGLIALIACHFGLRVKPNTESLGQGTTASVVISITMVILVDALFAVVFQHVGI